MAQIKFTADLTAAEFPLLTQFAGRTVMQPSPAEGKPPITTPQVLYCQNALPTKGGYKSVSYQAVYGAASPANLNFSKCWTVQDPDLTKAKVGVTTDSRIYLLSAVTGYWADVTPALWAGGDKVTCATANGSTYLYLANFGCYKVSVAGITLTLTTLLGITAANITGCFNSCNYLCLFDGSHIYWCSTLNPLDFVPSLVTGAGSTIPTDLDGTIVAVAQLNNGFAIYSTANIVLSTFSNNTQFPWIFVNANNGSGITSDGQVSTQNNLGFHVALTFAGVLQVTNQGCTQIVPEVSDFLAAKIYEAYDYLTHAIVSTPLAANLKARMAIIGARYVVLSYGVEGTVGYSDALVRDLTLNRWGKLTVQHAAVLEFDTGITTGAQTYVNLPNAYSTYTALAYNQATAGLTAQPQAGGNFGILGVEGSISLAVLDQASLTDTAVLVLGKYQATRNYTLSLEGVEVESIAPNNIGFAVYDSPSIDGKNLLPARTLTLNSSGAASRQYGCRIAGLNHMLAFIGSFNLSAIELTATLGGRR